MMGLFLRKKLTVKIHELFLQKSSTFGWVRIKALGNTVKKWPFERYFLSYVKLFRVFILIMHILFWRTNYKNLLQKIVKDRAVEAYLLTVSSSP